MLSSQRLERNFLFQAHRKEVAVMLCKKLAYKDSTLESYKLAKLVRLSYFKCEDTVKTKISLGCFTSSRRSSQKVNHDCAFNKQERKNLSIGVSSLISVKLNLRITLHWN